MGEAPIFSELALIGATQDTCESIKVAFKSKVNGLSRARNNILNQVDPARSFSSGAKDNVNKLKAGLKLDSNTKMTGNEPRKYLNKYIASYRFWRDFPKSQFSYVEYVRAL